MYLMSVHLLIVIVGPPILAQKRNTALLQVLYNTVKVHFSAHEKNYGIIGQNGPLEKIYAIFIHAFKRCMHYKHMVR